MVFVLYSLLGTFAGMLAGLFGIGGGLIIVPALIFSFKLQGLSSDILTHLAIGTSLATIVVTSISSIRTHHIKGAVKWPVFIYLALGILVGAWLGVVTAVSMKGETLQNVLGLFAVLVGIKMWFGFKPAQSGKRAGKVVLALAGSVIGWASSIFGIGGGTLSVPFLRRSSLSMGEAVGTSAACGLPIAIVGASSNMFLGSGHALLPEWSTGFVYWPAFFGIVLTSVFFARQGARLAHKLPADKLQKCFSVFLFIVGAKFLWPL